MAGSGLGFGIARWICQKREALARKPDGLARSQKPDAIVDLRLVDIGTLARHALPMIPDKAARHGVTFKGTGATVHARRAMVSNHRAVAP